VLLLFDVVIALVALERLAELVVATRNARWAFELGAVELGRGHYPPMVALHTALLVACVAEAHLADRPFIPALGWTALVLAIGSQALRWWCIATLGRQWNTRVIVIPGAPLVSAGPYRWMSHPNYVAVVVEGLALPLIHTSWLTAVSFTLLNAVLLLRFRIPAEERALDTLAAGPRP
jgi:methyltransferase